MVNFKAEMERFERMGEKTGWTYVSIPAAIADQIKPGCRKSFRIRGKIDQVTINGLSLVPMGEGDFILALKAALRKQLNKEEGSVVSLELEEDVDFKIDMPPELELCLSDDPQLMEHFLSFAKSHQHYYINWLNTAKTEQTRVKRLTMIVNAMDQRLTFREMIRAQKN